MIGTAGAQGEGLSLIRREDRPRHARKWERMAQEAGKLLEFGGGKVRESWLCDL